MAALNLNIDDFIIFHDTFYSIDNDLLTDNGIATDVYARFDVTKIFNDSVMPNNLSVWSSLISNPLGSSLIHEIGYGDNVFVAITRDMYITRSLDNGVTWSSLISNPFEYELYSIGYGNGVWLIGSDNGQLCRSTDNCATISSLITNPFAKGIYGIVFGNNTFICCGKINSELMRSTDNGVTWGSLITNPFGGTGIRDGAFGNNVFVIVGDSGKMARSTDNGVTWGSLITNTFDPSKSINDIAFGNDVFVAVGQDGQIARSLDNGVTWGSLILNPFGVFIGIYAITFGDGLFVAVGDNGEVAYSSDGQSWSSLISNSHSTSSLYGVVYGSNTFVMGGDSGKISYSNVEIFFDVGKNLSDTITLSDLLTKISEFARTLEDTITLSDLLSSAQGYARTLEDTITLSDLFSYAQGFARTLEDTITLSDLVTYVLIYNVLFEDTITLSDLESLVRIFNLTNNDTITLSDEIIQKDVGKNLSDTITLVDLLSRVVEYDVTLLDTITLSELSVVTKILNKRFVDRIYLSDNQLMLKTIYAVLEDTITLEDLPTVTRIFNLLNEDTIVLEDLATVIRILNLNASDEISATDLLTRIVDFDREISDTITLSDLATTISEFARTLEDTITLSDLATVVKIFNQDLSDSVTLSDEIIQKDVGKNLSDTITLVDLLDFVLIWNILFEDTITLSDLATVIRILNLNNEDTITLSDLATVIRILNLNASDTITLSEVLTKVIDFERTLEDTITTVSLLSRSVDYWKMFNDAFTVTDLATIVKLFLLLLSDLVSLSDSDLETLIENDVLILQYILKLKKTRSNLIDTYTPLFVLLKEQAKERYIETKNYIKRVLFGDNNFLGYDTLIDAYWNICILLRQSGSLTFDLTDALIETWTSFSNPVFTSDGSLVSPTSRYITDNGLTLSSSSVFDTLITQLGTLASSIGFYDSGFYYATQILALSNQTIFDNNRKGTGVLGLRSADSLPKPTPSQDPFSPFYWRFQIGDGVIDTPDYWEGTILTNLQTVITRLSSIKNTYNVLLDNFYDNLIANQYIINKDMFDTFDENRLAFEASIDAQVTTLTSSYNVLNTLKDDLTTNRAAINTALISLSSNINSYKSIDEARITEIASVIGSCLTEETLNYNRRMVLAQLVQYPDGMIPILYLMNDDLSVLNQLLIKTEDLLLASGIDYDEMIPQPIIKSLYKLGTVAVINFNSNFHPNQYKIYRKLAENVTDNSPWSEDKLIHTLDYSEGDIDPETLWTIMSYSDSTIVSGNIYVYRIKSIDTWWSSHTGVCHDSQSEQSDVYADGEILTNCII